MLFQVGIAGALFISYWFLLSKLVDAILEAPRLKSAHWIVVDALNTLIVFGVYAASSNAILSYCTMMLLMLIEFCVCYKDRFSGALLCTLACCIHVLSIFTVTISAMSMITGRLPYEICSSPELFISAVIIAFAILAFIIIGAIKLVPLSLVKLINQHKEQQWFIIAWMLVNSALLSYVAIGLMHPLTPAHLFGNQIAASIAALASLYIVLFFSFKTSAALGYKEKSKLLEQTIHQEQQYRISMVKDAIASYEINVTQNSIVKGIEIQGSASDDKTSCYNDILQLLSRKVVYAEDVDEFIQKHTSETILKRFENGESEISMDYRRLREDGEWAWVRATANLVEDLQNGDVKAFVCVKDIDAEKKAQLELQRLAQRDPLTGLYNKTMTGKLIDEHLAASEHAAVSALFMIDIDNFKEINDQLGHSYGDVVLCELADQLPRIFRKNDIVGRIGGDEFIAFLKDGASTQLVEQKAKQICNAFRFTYEDLNGEEHSISSSVGISIAPQDGCSFAELYSCADTALYIAKIGGKNTYERYDGRSFTGYTSQRTEIEAVGNSLQKSFRENRIEYIFKMLYHSDNPVAAIHSALELIASHFSFGRGYIFETSKDGKTTSNTFEWCAEGVASQRSHLQNLPIEVVATANASFEKNGIFILKSLDELPSLERAVLEPLGIKSMFQFGIFDKSRLLGFIGFDNCDTEKVPSDIEIDEMETICNILATFFVKQHIDEAASSDLLARQEVMNHLNSYIYVVRPQTFEVLFMNDKIRKLMHASQSETACYRFFRGNEEQCADCPMHKLRNDETERIVCEVYNNALQIWMEVTASTLRWTDENLVYLMNCVDITEQKEARLQHIQQLETLAYVDELTGCRSYYKFKEDAQRILEQQQDTQHFLVKLDIDNFKLINQIYGYEKGNEILCYVAQAIEKTTRNENEIFARVANDEFIALFAIEQKQDIEILYRIFLHHFAVLVDDDFAFKCNFPHGRYIIDASNRSRLDVNDMFEKVNIAHKAAKLNKSLEYMFYDERMTEEALYAQEIENQMSDALANDDFIVYLQPKYDLRSETIGGAEALTRWKRADGDLRLPNTFIPIFELNGFIVTLDFYIFQKVCDVIKSWIDAGLEPVVVSVNFSRLHLGDVDFVKKLRMIVDSVGIQRKYLEIEITETVIYDNINTLELLLNDIHKSGFSMSMDDFGSGYSSLGMLKDLPVDVIKLDRSFFADQRDAERSKIVVGSVIQMAADLGIRTVAEGVEEQAHIDILRELHCDMVQGYYYAKPMSIENFTKLLEKEHGE